MTKPASEKQITFLRSLEAERDLSGSTAVVTALATRADITSLQASDWISWALRQPRKPKPAGPRFGGDDVLADALATAVPSMYAVPTSGLRMIPGLEVRGDLLFLEVRRWKGRNYLNRLHGAPGSFSRSRFNRSQQLALLAVIAGKHQEYARLFGEHYTCCGRCAAPLTDQRSRELFLGPTCAGYFGVKF